MLAYLEQENEPCVLTHDAIPSIVPSSHLQELFFGMDLAELDLQLQSLGPPKMR